LSNIRADEISDAAGTGPITLTKQSAAKAWLNFDATASNSIRSSFNISGITDNGTGNFTPNMVSAMANNRYAASCAISESGAGGIPLVKLGDGYTTTNFILLTANITGAASANTLKDYKFVQATLHGDVA